MNEEQSMLTEYEVTEIQKLATQIAARRKDNVKDEEGIIEKLIYLSNCIVDYIRTDSGIVMGKRIFRSAKGNNAFV